MAVTELRIPISGMARKVVVLADPETGLPWAVSVECDSSVEWSLIGGLLMPDAFTVHAFDAVGTQVVFERHDGVYRCVDLHMARPSSLGGVPLGALEFPLGLVREVALRAIASPAEVAEDRHGMMTVGFNPFDTAEGRHLHGATMPRAGRPRLTDEHYAAVGLTYRQAYDAAEGGARSRNRAGLDAVLDAHGRTERTAQRWVKKARERGLIPEEYRSE